MKNICHNFYRTIIFNASALFVKDTINNREKDDKKPTSSVK